VALGALVVLAVLAFGRGGGDDHHLEVLARHAGGIRKGYEVRAAGRPVGKVTEASVTRDRRARIVIRVDDKVWPLPRDTRLAVRMGGTIKFSDRYLDVRVGDARHGVFAEGDRVPTAQYDIPVEFDDVFRTFDAKTRTDLKSTIDHSGPVLNAAAPSLRRVTSVSPPAVQQARDLLDDVVTDRPALDVLIRQSDRVVAAVRKANPGVRELLSDAGATFAAVGDRAAQVQTSIRELPHTLTTARTTLTRARSTLQAVDVLASDLDPGIAETRALAAPLTRALTTVREVGPVAQRAVATLRRATPDLNSLLTRATDLLPDLESTAEQAAKQLNCVRPYTPEIAGFASTWGAGIWSRGDRKDKYLRANVGATIEPSASPFNAATLHKMFPGVTTQFPRPPGALSGQPWLIPECGVGPDAIDPDQDAEATNFDPMSKNLLQMPKLTSKAP
jgi:ABC-type transporter Mla subunit MlaD